MSGIDGLRFAPIDLARHAALCLAFRRDMYACSFGGEDGLEDEIGPAGATYLGQLFKRLEHLPEGNAHLWRSGDIVAQTEMSLLEEEPGVGYVHLFYVTPSQRGLGLGRLLHQHAAAVFTGRGMRLMRLSVGARNAPAIGFYRALGWRRVGSRPHREVMDVMEYRL
jgi:ribosomal protein S18 acetylase RimI-like enzyme